MTVAGAVVTSYFNRQVSRVTPVGLSLCVMLCIAEGILEFLHDPLKGVRKYKRLS